MGYSRVSSTQFVELRVTDDTYLFSSSCVQCRGERHLFDGLHPSPACGLRSPHGWPLRQETIQEGSDANCRAISGQVLHVPSGPPP